VNPILAEEMAWSFAQLVKRNGTALDEYLDREFARLLPKGSDRRACIAIALTREWVCLEDYGLKAYGRDYYIQGPAFEHEKRRRHESLHGIGSYPREEWEDAGKILP